MDQMQLAVYFSCVSHSVWCGAVDAFYYAYSCNSNRQAQLLLQYWI